MAKCEIWDPPFLNGNEAINTPHFIPLKYKYCASYYDFFKNYKKQQEALNIFSLIYNGKRKELNKYDVKNRKLWHTMTSRFLRMPLPKCKPLKPVKS